MKLNFKKVFSNTKVIPKSNDYSFIGHNTNFNGDFSFDGTLHFSGRLDGRITSDLGTLYLHGEVNGDIFTSSAIINGVVNGYVVVENNLILTSRARVTGSITYQKMSMEPGAIIKGEVLHATKSSSSLALIKEVSK